MSVGMPVTSVTVESVTYTRNAATTLVGDQNSVQSGNRNTYGVITAAGMNRPTHSSWGLGQLLLGAVAQGGNRLQTPIPMCQELGGCHSLTYSHLSFSHSTAKHRSGRCRSACGVPALCSAGAAGDREGVPDAVREEGLTTLRTSSCHHVTSALSGNYGVTCTAASTPAFRRGFWPHRLQT